MSDSPCDSCRYEPKKESSGKLGNGFEVCIRSSTVKWCIRFTKGCIVVEDEYEV